MLKHPEKEKIVVFACCLALAETLCVGQIMGSYHLLLLVFAAFLLLTTVTSLRGMATALLLFFLPWSTLMKLENGGYSLYSVALLLVCMLLLLKSGGNFRKATLIPAFLLLDISLLSRLLQGETVTYHYLLMLVLFFLFPNAMEEKKQRGDFAALTLFFSGGIISAALSAQLFSGLAGIDSYINVYQWDGLVRWSGFYGDANFYAAQITAALAGVLLLLAEEKRKSFTLFYGALTLTLVYCGLLSASKSFFLTLIVLLILWVILLLWKRRWLLLSIVVVSGFVLLSTGLFRSNLTMILHRFHDSGSLSAFTTGRFDLWLNYIKKLLEDVKISLMGVGLCNIKLDGRSSHSTILQIFYQLGILGTAALAAWEIAYLGNSLRQIGRQLPKALLLAAGIFLPWLALDLLFFDEFFLLPLYFAAGLCYEKGGSDA